MTALLLSVVFFFVKCGLLTVAVIVGCVFLGKMLGAFFANTVGVIFSQSGVLVKLFVGVPLFFVMLMLTCGMIGSIGGAIIGLVFG